MDNKNDETPWPEAPPAPELGKEPSPIVAEMVACGMDPIVAALTARKHPEEHIRRQIQVVATRPGVRNPGAYLLTAIREDYAVSVPKPGSEYEQAYLAERKLPAMPTESPEAAEAKALAARRKREAEEAAKRAADEARAIALRDDPEAQERKLKAMAEIREKLATLGNTAFTPPPRAPEVARMPRVAPLAPPPGAADGLARMSSVLARMPHRQGAHAD